MYCKYISKYIQQDATLHSFFISGNCSTRFGCYFHTSSGAQTAVSTAFGICHTYCYLLLSWRRWNRFEWAVGGVRHPQHTQTSSNSSTTVADSSNGVTNTRCCRYSCMRSWWWVEVPPETCRAVSRYTLNKLCNDGTCWIYIGILLRAHCILHISRIKVNRKEMWNIYAGVVSHPWHTKVQLAAFIKHWGECE